MEYIYFNFECKSGTDVIRTQILDLIGQNFLLIFFLLLV